MIEYQLIKQDKEARLGEIKTKRGVFKTPLFMPVGTLANVKGLTSAELVSLESGIILANAYHLWLRPGEEIIAKIGGLHQFMSFPNLILTDSGGFQVFSLAKPKDINEEGVAFKSHLDGQKLFLTPEKSIAIQNKLNSDIAMVFDECPPFPSTYDYMQQSVERTLRWAQRCKESHQNKKQALFGIIQGGEYADLRKHSAIETVKIGFDGYAIGGVSVGEDKKTMYQMIDDSVLYMPKDKVRYLMGVGDPVDLIEAVKRGIDIFDCVLPTRLARHANAFTKQGRINLKNAQYQADFTPIAKDCNCDTCQNYSKAYLRHLFMAKETLAGRLVSIHNLYFLKKLMDNIQEAIAEDRFTQFADDFLDNYQNNN